MNKELILRYSKQLRESSPIEYEGLQIYPVLFKDSDKFNAYSQCLTFNPVYYPDTELSSLPRLYFITSVLNDEYSDQITPERKSWLLQLIGLLNLTIKNASLDFVQNGNYYALRFIIDGDNSDRSNNVIINSSQFEEIRKIILIQNDVDFNDEYIHPDILKWIEKEKETERKKENSESIETLEDRVETLMVAMSQPDEHFLDNMTIRRVNRLFVKVIDREIYNAQITGAMSGMVTFKEQPISWTKTKQKQSDFDRYLKEIKQSTVSKTK